MGVAENIDAIMAEFDIPASSIARAAGVSDASVSDWRNNGAIPRKKNLMKLCEYFGLTPDDILSDSSGFAAKAHGRTGVTYAYIPLYGSVSAGWPMEMIPVEETKEAPPKFVEDDGKCFYVHVRGNSMSHIMQDGELALVSPKYNMPNEHDPFLVSVNGDEATIKKLHKLDNGIELVPDSYDPTYRSQVFDFGDENAVQVKIIGKVVWHCAEF